MENNEHDLARSENLEISDRLQSSAAVDTGTPIARAESGHTPGPWHTRRDGGGWLIVGPTPRPDDCVRLWCVARTISDEPEDAPNARLIAAAPDLLAAAREAWEELAQCRQNDDVERVMNQLRAAIMKAEGVE